MANISGIVPAGTVIGDYTVPCDVPFVTFGKGRYSNQDVICEEGSFYIFYQNISTSSNMVCCCSSESTPHKLVFGSSIYNLNVTPLSYTFDEKTVYYGGNLNVPPYEPSPSAHPTENINTTYVSWAIVYGGFGGYTVTYDLDNCIGDSDNPLTILPSAVVTNALFTTDTGAAFNSGSVWIDGDGALPGVSVDFVWEPETGSLKIGQVSSNITVHVYAVVDPYSGSGGTSPIPGGGSVSIPGMPGLTATSSGVIGLFAPSVSQMRSLADFMWTDFGGTGTTTEDILKEIVQAIKRTISNPLDYIIGFNIIPSQGLSIGSSSTIRFGYINSNVSMPRLSNQYFTVDCGSIHFNTVCDDTFLDYAPYAKFSIYLPYIGVKEVDANDFVGHTIGVMYRGDVVTGGVTAYILKDGSVMYQYSGCCALNIPLTADNWGSIISGVINIATSVVGGFATGGAAGAASGALKGAANVAANPASLSPQVMRSGAVSGSAGCMGVQYPFVIREAVSYHDTAGFNTVEGYPSFYFKSLGSIHGYTVVSKVNLVNIPATRDELTEIEKLLKEGVIF